MLVKHEKPVSAKIIYEIGLFTHHQIISRRNFVSQRNIMFWFALYNPDQIERLWLMAKCASAKGGPGKWQAAEWRSPKVLLEPCYLLRAVRTPPQQQQTRLDIQWSVGYSGACITCVKNNVSAGGRCKHFCMKLNSKLPTFVLYMHIIKWLLF